MTALPCRLQNDSPPNSIDQPHLNKGNDTPKIPNLINDSSQRINENNNLIKTPKLPPDIENAIDESNYVNLNEITAKCKSIASDFTRNIQKPTDIITNSMEKPNMNGIDNKNSKLNNFYLQINSTAMSNGYNTSKPIMSIVNQKNLNNINNNNNNLSKNGLTNVSNTNGLTNGFSANNLNNNFNSNNNNNLNGNCNGVLNDNGVDGNTITTNGIDYNKNGLPAVSTTHMQNDVANGHQTQCMNKNGNPNNATPQTYVIHNGNGLLTNGNNGIKDIPRVDSNKGKYSCFCVLILIAVERLPCMCMSTYLAYVYN